jgi:hypothetical protein
MQMGIHTISMTHPPPPDDESAHEELLIHSDPFGGLMVHFIGADRNYDHTLEDLILCNVHTDDDDNVSITSFSSAWDGPSTYEDVIDLLAAECMGMQDIDDIQKKG